MAQERIVFPSVQLQENQATQQSEESTLGTYIPGRTSRTVTPPPIARREGEESVINQAKVTPGKLLNPRSRFSPCLRPMLLHIPCYKCPLL